MQLLNKEYYEYACERIATSPLRALNRDLLRGGRSDIKSAPASKGDLSQNRPDVSPSPVKG